MPRGGPTIIVTRPEAQAREFCALLEERLGHSATCLVAPIQRIVPTPLELDPEDFGTFIFTSVNGVRAFPFRDGLVGRLAYCVGKRTGAEASKAGFSVVTGKGNADDLADLILQDRPRGPWLHVSGKHTRGNLADRLRALGHPTEHAVVYHQQSENLSDEARDAMIAQRVILPVFSPRTATLLSEMVPEDAHEPDVAAISTATAECWCGPVRRLAIAQQPNSGAMLDILGMLVRTDSQS